MFTKRRITKAFKEIRECFVSCMFKNMNSQILLITQIVTSLCKQGGGSELRSVRVARQQDAEVRADGCEARLAEGVEERRLLAGGERVAKLAKARARQGSARVAPSSLARRRGMAAAAPSCGPPRPLAAAPPRPTSLSGCIHAGKRHPGGRILDVRRCLA